MAKIGYSFDGDRRAIKPRRRKSSAGSWFIAIVLLIVVGGGSWFIFFHSTGKETAGNPVPPIVEAEKAIAPYTTPQPAESQSSAGSGSKESNPAVPKKNDSKSKPIVAQKAPVAKEPPKINPAVIKLNKLCTQAALALQEGEYATARQLMLQALAQPEIKRFSPAWYKAAELLSQADSAIISSDVPLPGKKVRYTVQKGDALRKIANKFNTTVEFIQRGNGMKKNNYIVWEGQELKIYHGRWQIEISKKERLLMLYDGNELFKIYHVCIGRQNRTPEGNFMIVSKKKNPTWYKSKKEIIPFGTKENVLGTRWMALRSTDEKNRNLTGYGIHGTWNDASIGKAASNGCIRMKNSDVEELFAIVPYKTKVVIKK